MQVIIERAHLIDIVTRATSIVETRKSVPILSHVVLATGTDSLSVTATDLDIDVSDSAPADVEKPGRIAVPAILLAEITKKTSGAEIAFRYRADNETVEITSGKAKFKLPCLPAADFPETHQIGVTLASFPIGVAPFMDLIKSVKYAMSTEQTRFYLCGVYLHSHNSNTLRAVATNGHYLARRDMPAPAGAGGLDGVLLPAKLVNTLAKIVDGAGDTEMTMSVNKVRVQFRIGTLTLTGKLIDGTFPDYARIIPKDHKTTMTANARDLSDVIDRVGTLVETGVNLGINGALTVTGKGLNGGTSEDSIDIEHTGPNLEIGFNAKYLVNTLGHIDGSCRWEFGGADSPAMVTDANDPSKLYVLMPMRV